MDRMKEEITLRSLPDIDLPEDEPWARQMRWIIETQKATEEVNTDNCISREELCRREALILKGGIFSKYSLNLIFREIESRWTKDECIIPSLISDKPDFLREIIEIEAMCFEADLDGEVLEQRVRSLIINYYDDLNDVRDTEDFLDMWAESKY